MYADFLIFFEEFYIVSTECIGYANILKMNLHISYFYKREFNS
jgi:hypothetical protein